MVEQPEVAEEEWTPAPLESLTFFYTNEGIPVFTANALDICDHIEAHGFQIYYVIAYAVKEEKQKGVTKKVYRPAVYRITNSIIARSIAEKISGDPSCGYWEFPLVCCKQG